MYYKIKQGKVGDEVGMDLFLLAEGGGDLFFYVIDVDYYIQWRIGRNYDEVVVVDFCFVIVVRIVGYVVCRVGMKVVVVMECLQFYICMCMYFIFGYYGRVLGFLSFFF